MEAGSPPSMDEALDARRSLVMRHFAHPPKCPGTARLRAVRMQF